MAARAGSGVTGDGMRAAPARGRGRGHCWQKSVPLSKSWKLGKGKPSGPVPEPQKSLPSCLNSKE